LTSEEQRSWFRNWHWLIF